MDHIDETKHVNELLVRWNSIRQDEVRRLAKFTVQRDSALARWHECGPHTEADEHYVEFRLARSVVTSAEVRELETRIDAALTTCRDDFSTSLTLSALERRKSLSRISDVAASALRQDMRYLSALTSSLKSEVDQMVSFMLEREEETG
jgi:hypothetical protein